ncbi:MAG: hypothetical protein IPI18_03390 [Saprospiraceae bacterium]|nr:hypothetical protein [Saprospiraceae bacterium]
MKRSIQYFNFQLAEGAFTLAMLSYIILRAVKIPVTHDEAGTILNYASRSIYSIITYEDPIPNNHLLNTLLIKFSISVLGLNEFACRLPNLIGGFMYLWFGIKISNLFSQKKIIQTCFLLLLVANPYLTEFFALARGYGLSIGFMMGSLYYYFSWQEGANKGIWAMILGALGVYANLTLLNYFIPLCGIMLVGWFQRPRDWRLLFSTVFIIIVLMMALYLPITKMIRTEQFVYWGSRGFYQDTFVPLLNASLMGKKYFGSATAVVFTWFIFILILIQSVAIGLSMFLTKPLRVIYFNSICIFFFAVLYNILQNKLFNIPFLNARTALFFYPLLMMGSIGALLYFHGIPWLRIVIKAIFTILFIFSIVHIYRSYNLHSSYEWWFDGDNKRVVSIIGRDVITNHRSAPATLHCDWIFQPSLTFYTKGQANPYIVPPPYNKGIDTVEVADYYYITSDDMNDWIKEKYDTLSVFAWGSRLLMKKKTND